jgi:hypothetical protein
MKMLPHLVKGVAAVLGLPMPKQGEGSGSGPVHKGIRCDVCGREDIQGARFKCTECPNYDLCSSCEQLELHPHCLMKIKSPSQAPSYVLAGNLSHPLLQCLSKTAGSRSKRRRPH